ncbi:MAG: tetratricopeptide repeat protein [Planctomycetes bacterium]|nr:tetratricopeptide repeat protein [Planctomycetota bacterium]
MQATKLARNDGDLVVLPERRPQTGRPHTLRAEAHEETLRLWIDEQLCFTVRDRFPLEGHHIALYGFATAARIRRLRVWTAGVPRRRSCVAVPDAFAARGLWAEALAEYDRIRASYPGSAEADEALFKSAICLMELARADEARERLAMLEATPLAPLACVCQSAILQRAGAAPETEAAVLAGGLARSYGAHTEGVQDLHLRAHLRARDFKLAEHYGAAIRLWQVLADTREAPEFLRVGALMDLGNILANEGEYAASRKACQRLCDEFPHLPTASSAGLTLLANAYNRQGLHEQARRTASQVLERYPRLDMRCVHAQLILGRAWAAEGVFERAREALEHLIANYPHQANYLAQARQLLGRCWYMQGRGDQARAAWSLNQDVYAPALLPSGNSLIDLAWLDHESGDGAAARRRIEQVMELCKDEREGNRGRRAAALLALGHMEARDGREAEALSIFGRIPAEYPDWSSTGARALAAAARLHLRRGRFEDARACCERILNEAARTKDLRTLGERHLGLVERARGDGAAASERWARIAQDNPLGHEARAAQLWKALAGLEARRDGEFRSTLQDLADRASRHGWNHDAWLWTRCLGSAPGQWARDAAGTALSPAEVLRRTAHGDRDEFHLMLELRAGLDPAWREAIAGLSP